MRTGRIGFCLLGLALLPRFVAGAAVDRVPDIAPRPLDADENAAVALAVRFAERGAEAWWESLAEDAPLAALPRQAAIRELEARLGPRRGATWTLESGGAVDDGVATFAVEFPSGIDDVLTLELAPGPEPRLRSVRCLADTVAADEPILGRTARVEGPATAAALAALISLLVAAALAGSGLRGRAVALAVLVLLLGCRGGGEGEGAGTGGPPLLELGTLADLRAALAEGHAVAETAPAGLPPQLAAVRELWLAQAELASGRFDAAERRLVAARSSEPTPLARLLEARLALARLDLARASAAYEAAIAAIGTDGLRLEAIDTGLSTNRAWKSEIEIDLMTSTGSRRPEPWLMSAAGAVAAGDVARAEKYLAIGWRLRPQPREDLMSHPALASLAARPDIFPMLGLDRAEEPLLDGRLEAATRAPLALAPGFEASLCGRELRLERDEFEILVPAGESLAPTDVEVESAVTRTRRAEERARRTAGGAVAAVRSGAARIEPRLERQALLALRALARESAWAEVLELSSAFFRGADQSHPEISRYRAIALERVGRDREALDALIDLAERELKLGRPAPDLLLELAGAFARAGDPQRAFQLAERAARQLPIPPVQVERNQYRMSLELERDSLTHASSGFELRAPRSTGDRYPRQLAAVLRKERDRLSRWIPGAAKIDVRVELYPFEDFLRVYGFDIGGVTLRDGRVRVPFADIRSLHPELIATLSHELAHAMLVGTAGQAVPRWFHEGVAQHIEMGIGRINPVPDLEREGRVLAFPVIEAVLAGFAEPNLVEIAYAESAWVVHFIESRWGVGALHRLQSEFGRGAGTEPAIREVTGLDPIAFDREFRRWAREDAPAGRSLEVRDYAAELDERLDGGRFVID